MTRRPAKRLLAVASAGGHFQQLMLLRPAFGDHDVRFVTTKQGLAQSHGATPAHVVPDSNRDTPVRAGLSFLALVWVMIRVRPHAVISTGALPGVFALILGRMIGARTIWVDSVANAEEMSSSGLLARRFAGLWLSQWPEVARAEGADFAGALL